MSRYNIEVLRITQLRKLTWDRLASAGTLEEAEKLRPVYAKVWGEGRVRVQEVA